MEALENTKISKMSKCWTFSVGDVDSLGRGFVEKWRQLPSE